jgi:hypothetical protein
MNRAFLKLPPLLISTICALVSYLTLGPTLAAFLAGLIVVTLLAPMLTLADETALHRALAFTAVITPIAIMWAVPVFQTIVLPGEWFLCVLVLSAYAAALAGLAALFERLRFSAVAASAIVVVLGLVWLSWPIWLAPWLTGPSAEQRVARLVSAHPLFAISSALARPFPNPWAEYDIAYRLTNIGDDIPYELPATILKCLLFHLLVAALSFTVALFSARPRRLRSLVISQ